MAEFPPNLDDGELWIPSDILVNDVPSKYKSYRLSCMEDLSGRFAALSLLQTQSSPTPSRPPPKPPLSSQSVKMAVRDIPASHLPSGYLGINGGVEFGQRLYGCGTGSVLARSEPSYEFQPQPQVCSYMETRPRVLQRQQNPLQSRLDPFQGSGFGFRGSAGGIVRESGGTGVFHPRIVNPTTATPATADAKRKRGMRSKREIQATQQRNSTRRVGVNQEVDSCRHIPPDMGLPQDWTY